MTINIGRREILAVLGGIALLTPRAASAQQVRPARIGILPQGSPSNAYDRSLVEAFREGLREVGLVENRDIILDVAWITGGHDQAVAKLIQLIEHGAKVLITSGSTTSERRIARRQQLPLSS